MDLPPSSTPPYAHHMCPPLRSRVHAPAHPQPLSIPTHLGAHFLALVVQLSYELQVGGLLAGQEGRERQDAGLAAQLVTLTAAQRAVRLLPRHKSTRPQI
jgi:hypothetical protein